MPDQTIRMTWDKEEALARLAELRAGTPSAGMQEFLADLGARCRRALDQMVAALREWAGRVVPAFARLTAALRPLMRALRPRSPSRAARRAEPATRAVRLARRARRRELARGIREAGRA